MHMVLYIRVKLESDHIRLCRLDPVSYIPSDPNAHKHAATGWNYINLLLFPLGIYIHTFFMAMTQ